MDPVNPPADVHQAFVQMKLDPVFSLGQIVFYNTKDLFKKHNFGRDVKRFVNKNDWCVYNNKYHLNARGVITLGFAKKHNSIQELVWSFLDLPPCNEDLQPNQYICEMDEEGSNFELSMLPTVLRDSPQVGPFQSPRVMQLKDNTLRPFPSGEGQQFSSSFVQHVQIGVKEEKVQDDADFNTPDMSVEQKQDAEGDRHESNSGSSEDETPKQQQGQQHHSPHLVVFNQQQLQQQLQQLQAHQQPPQPYLSQQNTQGQAHTQTQGQTQTQTQTPPQASQTQPYHQDSAYQKQSDHSYTPQSQEHRQDYQDPYYYQHQQQPGTQQQAQQHYSASHQPSQQHNYYPYQQPYQQRQTTSTYAPQKPQANYTAYHQSSAAPPQPYSREPDYHFMPPQHQAHSHQGYTQHQPAAGQSASTTHTYPTQHTYYPDQPGHAQQSRAQKRPQPSSSTQSSQVIYNISPRSPEKKRFKTPPSLNLSTLKKNLEDPNNKNAWSDRLSYRSFESDRQLERNSNFFVMMNDSLIGPPLDSSMYFEYDNEDGLTNPPDTWGENMPENFTMLNGNQSQF